MNLFVQYSSACFNFPFFKLLFSYTAKSLYEILNSGKLSPLYNLQTSSIIIDNDVPSQTIWWISTSNTDLSLANFTSFALINGAFDKSKGFTKSKLFWFLFFSLITLLFELFKFVSPGSSPSISMFCLSTTSTLKSILSCIFCTTSPLCTSKLVLKDSCLLINCLKLSSSFLASIFPSRITPPAIL